MLVSDKWASPSYVFFLCVCVLGGSLMSLVDCKILYLFACGGKLKFMVAYDVTGCRIVYLKKSHVS